MNSWKIRNEVITCIVEVVRRHIRYVLDNSRLLPVIADEVTDRYAKKENLLLCMMRKFTSGESYHSGNIFRLKKCAAKDDG